VEPTLVSDPLKIVLVAEVTPAWADATVRVERTLAEPATRDSDAVVFDLPDAGSLQALLQRPDLGRIASETAIVVIAPTASLADELALLAAGVQDVLQRHDSAPVWRALRHSIQRKRFEQELRPAYATDLATGLPHEAQLLEHTSQLIALRERQPAPMVLIVLRIEGLSSAARRLGEDAAHSLRRKVAVRLRTGLRASDVVAAVGPESFAVLLGHVDSADDGDRVASKLVQALNQPFQVAGHACAVGVAAGLARYPEHGKDATTLLQRALAQSASLAVMGREGFATFAERGPARAANDESGPT
jgi:diguanylate cyclase (GGDEF)-like protein